jgi:AcrR family transcriptional regulator
MTTKRAPKRPAEERRRLILEKAQAVFANSNYAKVGTAELAEAAGVSEPALYRYFSGKRDLYVATLKATGPRLLRIWQHVGDQVSDPLDVIRIMGLGYYEHVLSRSPVMKMFFEALSEADDPEIRATVSESFLSMVRFIEETLEAGKAQGIVRQDIDSRVAAWHFMAIGLAFDLIHLLGMDAELDHGKVEDWGRLYLESIREKPRGADKAKGGRAAGGTLSLWESPRQGLP